jgi:hypothetical protein
MDDKCRRRQMMDRAVFAKTHKKEENKERKKKGMRDSKKCFWKTKQWE